MTKIPYSPATGQRASSTAPETWSGYEEAQRACREQGFNGIGFVFTAEDDLCGVDLDGCLNPETGEIKEWAREIIEELDSYTEVSPSGSGIHVLVKGELPPGRNRKGRIEMYDKGRYFTVTGRHLAGTPHSIESRQEQLTSLARRVFGELEGVNNGHKTPRSSSAPSRMKRSLRKRVPPRTRRNSSDCGPGTQVATSTTTTKATARRTWPCARCSHSGPGRIPSG